MILRQCGFAYAVSLVIYQSGLLFTGKVNPVGLVSAPGVIVFILYMMIRPYNESRSFKRVAETD
mgnify:CR=1 FL=1